MSEGEMGERIRVFDWASTSLGLRTGWPAALRIAVNLLLTSSFPMVLLWSEHQVVIYNDASGRLFGDAHPQALGRTAHEVWPELWTIQNPVIQSMVQHGKGNPIEERVLRIHRNGHPEDISCTLCQSPVRHEDGTIGGVLVLVQETTQARKQARQLQESEQRLRVIVENSSDVIYLADVKTGRLVFVSSAYSTLTGLTAGEWENKTLVELTEHVHPDDRAPLIEQWQELAAGNETSGGLATYRWKTKSGEYRWISRSCKLVRDEHGQPVSMVGVCRDITAQKHAEEQLHYRASLLDTAADPVISTDEAFCIRSWNKAAEALYGFRESEALGRRLDELLHTEFPAPGRAYFTHRLEQDGLISLDVVHRNRQGAALHIHDHLVALRDANGRMRGTLGIFRDITERKRAEQERDLLLEELHAAQQQAANDLVAMTRLHQISSLYLHQAGLNSILDEILDATMALTGADLGTIRVVDSEAPSLRLAAQRGFPTASSDHWESCHFNQEAYDGMRTNLERIVVEDVTRSPAFQATPVLDRYRDAGVRAAQVTPLVSRMGQPLGLLSTYWKKPGRLDDRTLRLLDLLARQASNIIERAQTEESLKRVNVQLREADQRKNEFLAMLSHELRNPLAPIRNSLQLLDQVNPGSEAARRAKAILDRQVGLLARLVDDLLDITRIARNKIHLQLQCFDLDELARRTVEDHRAIVEKAGVHLEFVPAPHGLMVEGDWNRLAQVLGNLLHNAAKFTPQGGRVTVALSSAPSPGQAILRVQDTGIGITPNIRARLFQPFMQADTTLDRSKGGLGLGLALVKGVVELHGGAVDIHSEGLGKGTEMRVHLPLTSKVVTEPSPVSSRGPVSSRRVLIIEDNIDAADSLRDLLELVGHQVEVAHNGPEGIALAREFTPEVILCDIGLPGMDGFEVARTFKTDEALKAGYLVALSGYALPDDLERAAEAGFQHHLSKPPSLSKLAELLDTDSMR